MYRQYQPHCDFAMLPQLLNTAVPDFWDSQKYRFTELTHAILKTFCNDAGVTQSPSRIVLIHGSKNKNGTLFIKLCTYYILWRCVCDLGAAVKWNWHWKIEDSVFCVFKYSDLVSPWWKGAEIVTKSCFSELNSTISVWYLIKFSWFSLVLRTIDKAIHETIKISK